MKFNALAVLPVVVFGALSVLLYRGLRAGDPSAIPSPLIGKAVPEFDLPAVPGLAGSAGLASKSMATGKVTVVNFFASWCVPCRAEAPVLEELAKSMALAGKDLRLTGIAYKDKAEDTRKFLAQDGNPFSAIGDDEVGRTFINWGAYGVPETYVVKGDGTIAYKFIGPLSPVTLQTKLMPEIIKAMR